MGGKRYIAELIKNQININLDDIEEIIEIPPNIEMGDYTLPCFKLLDYFKKSPNIIAEQLKSSLDKNNFDKIDNFGPYLNFFLNREIFIRETLERIISENTKKSNSNIGRNKVVCIETVLSNFEKGFTMRDIRSILISNSLCKLFRRQGYTVFSINGLRDYRNRIYNLDDNYLEKSLKLENIKRVYDIFNIKFDAYLEDSFYKEKIDSIIKELKNKGLINKIDNTEVINLYKYNMPPIIINNKKCTFYQERYICDSIYKKNRYNFYKCIYVTESEKILYFNQVFKVLDLADYEWSNECIKVGVGLTKVNDGKLLVIKENDTIVENFIDQAIVKAKKIIDNENLNFKNNIEAAKKIAIDSIVFTCLKNLTRKNTVFDLEEIFSVNGETILYIQNTYARANKILKNADEINLEADFSKMNSKEEFELVKILERFNSIVNEAMEKLEPSIITNYLIEIVKAFNNFYNSYMILDLEDKSLMKARVILVKATYKVIKSALELMGIYSFEYL